MSVLKNFTQKCPDQATQAQKTPIPSNFAGKLVGIGVVKLKCLVVTSWWQKLA
ncbi:hypothetical protein KPHES18084_02230 [Corynebacterium ulcerans]|uniref:Uncharacterized protein n=1 Tax=Corynebacterium ulcerans TaxID=65058 RepID=A0ABD7MU68_CORUL|nr:hypothetical protein CULTSU28_02640 [Corynebacterium ulcerans]SNV11236.1 Uncharacterised protein [Corynebacterium ulcerans]SQG52194.1 Uncharacterised protein [Corynebacterium ulcerans]SQH02809.1 Uncharacterised protein [Corynebacterium ulcerans]